MIELKSVNFWKDYFISPDEQFAYLLIPKNGSNSYRKFFMQNNWTHSKSRPSSARPIAHIQNPITRWVKGFVQYCYVNKFKVNDVLKSHEQILPAILDVHTMPISHLWNNEFHHTKFFDLNSSNLEKFVNLNVMEQRYHQADESKKNDYQLVTDFINYDRRMKSLKSFLYYDILKYQAI